MNSCVIFWHSGESAPPFPASFYKKLLKLLGWRSRCRKRKSWLTKVLAYYMYVRTFAVGGCVHVTSPVPRAPHEDVPALLHRAIRPWKSCSIHNAKCKTRGGSLGWNMFIKFESWEYNRKWLSSFFSSRGGCVLFTTFMGHLLVENRRSHPQFYIFSVKNKVLIF